MTDIYIATPTQADYDALMRLAEAAGYVWNSRCKPTEEHNFDRYGCETVVRMRQNMLLEYCDKPYYEDNQGATIETIDDLSKIAAIYKTESVDWDEYIKIRPMSPNQPGFALPCFIEHTDGEISFMNHSWAQALAVEYKPQESEEVMSEKVKFSKEVYDALKEYGLTDDGTELWPFGALDSLYDYWREHECGTLGSFIDGGVANQWKLIDALRYGYEPEPEQLYYVQFVEDDVESFLNVSKENGRTQVDDRSEGKYWKTKLTMPEIIAIDPRYKAFAVPVEEVDK